jgi:hypothetical protein
VVDVNDGVEVGELDQVVDEHLDPFGSDIARLVQAQREIDAEPRGEGAGIENPGRGRVGWATGCEVVSQPT